MSKHPIERGLGAVAGIVAFHVMERAQDKAANAGLAPEGHGDPAPEIAGPMLGLSPPPWQSGGAVHAYSFSSRLVFGGVLKGIRRVLTAFFPASQPHG